MLSADEPGEKQPTKLDLHPPEQEQKDSAKEEYQEQQ